ncbi:MAG: hypothetical protein QOE65_2162 [Solirubrobacteraceae bacterium]|nr:hypothetical protein [Solirubrobacteraceae bacterium]
MKLTRRLRYRSILVPVVQGVTAPPPEPEYHEDNTLVHWRFGPDLTARPRGHGCWHARRPARFRLPWRRRAG